MEVEEGGGQTVGERMVGKEWTPDWTPTHGTKIRSGNNFLSQ